MFKNAKNSIKKDPVYNLWTSLTLYYLYQMWNKKEKKLNIAFEIEEILLEALKMNDRDTNSLFLLLYITLDFNKTFVNYEIQLTHTVEDIAVWIKSINEYKGYIAWAEIYFGRGDSEFTIQTLEELIQIYPENPEAYFKLWSMYENGSEESLEIAEKCFLWVTNFFMIETK